MRSKKVVELIEALEPVAAEHGYEIVDAEILGSGKSPILRIYIDKEGGVNLDDISEAQQEWLEDVVDEKDIINGNYMLEVSSPGIDRPLRTREHFVRFAGENVKITAEPIDGRKRFNGKLQGMDGDDVVVEIDDGQVFHIPYDTIQTAKVKGKVEF